MTPDINFVFNLQVNIVNIAYLVVLLYVNNFQAYIYLFQKKL